MRKVKKKLELKGGELIIPIRIPFMQRVYTSKNDWATSKLMGGAYITTSKGSMMINSVGEFVAYTLQGVANFTVSHADVRDN